jgi:hypothetical protein
MLQVRKTSEQEVQKLTESATPRLDALMQGHIKTAMRLACASAAPTYAGWWYRGSGASKVEAKNAQTRVFGAGVRQFYKTPTKQYDERFLPCIR